MYLRGSSWPLGGLSLRMGGHEKVVVHVQMTEGGGLHPGSTWSPGEATDRERIKMVQKGSVEVHGALCGLEPLPPKLGLREEVIDCFQEDGGRRVEASWGRGHLTRFRAPSCWLVCLPSGIGTPSHRLGRAALAGWPEMLWEKRVWSHLR